LLQTSVPRISYLRIAGIAAFAAARDLLADRADGARWLGAIHEGIAVLINSISAGRIRILIRIWVDGGIVVITIRAATTTRREFVVIPVFCAARQ
jgi:hypothetical protein